jgi:hypothetical protein
MPIAVMDACPPFIIGSALGRRVPVLTITELLPYTIDTYREIRRPSAATMAAIISIAAMEKLRRCISFVAAHPTSFRFFVLVRLLRTSGAGLQAFGYPG